MTKRLLAMLPVLIFSSHSIVCQVTGEFVYTEYPFATWYDLELSPDKAWAVLVKIHQLEDTSFYNYSTQIHQLDILHDDTVTTTELFVQDHGTAQYISARLYRVGDRFILANSTYDQLAKDTFVLTILNSGFDVIEEIRTPVDRHIFHYCGTRINSDEHVGVATMSYPLDSLFYTHVTGEGQSSNIHGFQTTPNISFVSSLAHDSLRNRFLAFNLNGIAILDDSLQIVQRFTGPNIGASIHGTIIVDGPNYYSLGAALYFSDDKSEQNLFFQRYDTAMHRTFSDTFGRDHLLDYPFIHNSLDKSGGEFVIGGMLAGPDEITFGAPVRFFLARYDSSLHRIWYREYGGDTNYRINGLYCIDDRRCLVYGHKLVGGIPFPYLLILDENGEITSTENTPDPDVHLVDILYPSESGKFVFDAKSDLKSLHLYSMYGKVILRLNEILHGRHAYDVSALPAGMYVFVASDGERSQSGKWVKK